MNDGYECSSCGAELAADFHGAYYHRLSGFRSCEMESAWRRPRSFIDLSVDLTQLFTAPAA